MTGWRPIQNRNKGMWHRTRAHGECKTKHMAWRGSCHSSLKRCNWWKASMQLRTESKETTVLLVLPCGSKQEPHWGCAEVAQSLAAMSRGNFTYLQWMPMDCPLAILYLRVQQWLRIVSIPFLSCYKFRSRCRMRKLNNVCLLDNRPL